MTRVFLLFDVGVISGVKEKWNSCGDKNLKSVLLLNEKGEGEGSTTRSQEHGLLAGHDEGASLVWRGFLFGERGWDSGPEWPGGWGGGRPNNAEVAWIQ